MIRTVLYNELPLCEIQGQRKISEHRWTAIYLGINFIGTYSSRSKMKSLWREHGNCVFYLIYAFECVFKMFKTAESKLCDLYITLITQYFSPKVRKWISEKTYLIGGWGGNSENVSGAKFLSPTRRGSAHRRSKRILLRGFHANGFCFKRGEINAQFYSSKKDGYFSTEENDAALNVLPSGVRDLKTGQKFMKANWKLKNDLFQNVRRQEWI